MKILHEKCKGDLFCGILGCRFGRGRLREHRRDVPVKSLPNDLQVVAESSFSFPKKVTRSNLSILTKDHSWASRKPQVLHLEVSNSVLIRYGLQRYRSFVPIITLHARANAVFALIWTPFRLQNDHIINDAN